MKANNMKNQNKSIAKITLAHASVKVAIREEFYIYTGYGLFGNIGGLVGIFFGFNFLSLVDRLLPIISSCLKIPMCKKE